MPRSDSDLRQTADLDLLVVFAIVAREGSFTRAARVLGVSQPSVSARVRRLEKRLGEPVFRRLGRGVRLTPAGEALRVAANRALAVAQEAGELLAGVAGMERGYVRCAASTTIAGYVLPERMARFHALRPDVEIEIRVGNTAHVTELVERGDVRWGLVEGLVDTSRFSVQRFLEDELVLLVPPSHPWARRGRVEPEELMGTTFIGREEGSGTGGIYESALSALGIALHPTIRIAQSEGIISAVAAGAGVGIASALVAGPFLDARRVVRVALGQIRLARSLALIQRPGSGLSRLEAEFLDVTGIRSRPGAG